MSFFFIYFNLTDMKQSHKTVLLVLAILLLGLMSCPRADAQSDTVEYRLVRSMITDSTRVRFELGSVGFKHASDVRYLRFVDTLPASINTFYRTDTMTVSGSSDSICFFRFASFDDKNAIGPIPCGEIGSASWDSALTILKHRYVDSNITVSPDTSVFNLSSTIRYDLEIRDASNDTLIRTVDTLICFRASTGELSYATFPSNLNGATIALSGISSGTHIYVTENRYVALPTGVSFIADNFTQNSWNPPYVGPHVIDDTTTLGYADKRAYTPPPPVAPATVAIRFAPMGEHRATYTVNSALIKQTFEATSDGATEVQLVNSAGQIVLIATNMVHAGSNTLAIDSRRMPSGTYVLTVSLNGKIISNSRHLIIH